MAVVEEEEEEEEEGWREGGGKSGARRERFTELRRRESRLLSSRFRADSGKDGGMNY